MKIPEWMGDFGTEQSSYWIPRIPLTDIKRITKNCGMNSLRNMKIAVTFLTYLTFDPFKCDWKWIRQQKPLPIKCCSKCH